MAKGSSSRRDRLSQEIDEWAAAQGSQQKGFLLDALPEARDLFARMLERVPPGSPICWSSAARFVRARHPDAPKTGRAYKVYAIRKLGWEGG